MKLLLVDKLGAAHGLPRTSAHKLVADIIYSLVGYKYTKSEVTILCKDINSIQDLKVYNRVIYDDDSFSTRMNDLLKDKYDCVMVFDLEVVMKCKDLPISNLIFCVMECKPFLTQDEKDMLSNSWVKVISFLPRLGDIEGLKINRSCTPACTYMADENLPAPKEHDELRIIVPIDGRFEDKTLIQDLISSITGIHRKIREVYPNSEILFMMIGAVVSCEFNDPHAHAVGATSLGDYLQVLLDSDLQVVYKIPFTLDLFPLYGLEVGTPTALITDPSFLKDYPYLEGNEVEILGVNSVEMEAERVSNPDYRTYIRSLSSAHDELRFNIEFQTVVRMLANTDYRPEYRRSLDEVMEEFKKSVEEIKQNKSKEDKNECSN